MSERKSRAIVYSLPLMSGTEAPDILRGLARQRFRWSYGTPQRMWKERDALFSPRYGALGLVGMPDVRLFQILFPLIWPVMDLMLAWTLVGRGKLEREATAGAYP